MASSSPQVSSSEYARPHGLLVKGSQMSCVGLEQNRSWKRAPAPPIRCKLLLKLEPRPKSILYIQELSRPTDFFLAGRSMPWWAVGSLVRRVCFRSTGDLRSVQLMDSGHVRCSGQRSLLTHVPSSIVSYICSWSAEFISLPPLLNPEPRNLNLPRLSIFDGVSEG